MWCSITIFSRWGGKQKHYLLKDVICEGFPECWHNIQSVTKNNWIRCSLWFFEWKLCCKTKISLKISSTIISILNQASLDVMADKGTIDIVWKLEFLQDFKTQLFRKISYFKDKSSLISYQPIIIMPYCRNIV